MKAIQDGAIGDVTWVRARETHPGPHSAWFWDHRLTGGGAIIDLGCHCIEIGRIFVGKDNRPVEVMCHTDTLVHPIDAEDNAIALVRYELGAIGQFEVSWTFRGGMDLRDEVAGTQGTIWINHFLRTGFEMFTTGEGDKGYVAEKAETDAGWLFPVGDEVSELGYTDMFTDMFDAMDEGREPMETLYDGYVVNAIMDACYRSAKSRAWEPVELDWRGGKTEPIGKDTRDLRGPGGHQARAAARRPLQAHPQGPAQRRFHRPRRVSPERGRRAAPSIAAARGSMWVPEAATRNPQTMDVWIASVPGPSPGSEAGTKIRAKIDDWGPAFGAGPRSRAARYSAGAGGSSTSGSPFEGRKMPRAPLRPTVMTMFTRNAPRAIMSIAPQMAARTMKSWNSPS